MWPSRLLSWGCIHRRLVIQKMKLSAFSYAQLRISLVFFRCLCFCSLVFLPNSGMKVGESCVLRMEKILTVHFQCDLFLPYFVLCRIGQQKEEKKKISVWPSFQMSTNPRKPSNWLVFKNQGKKSAKIGNLGFLRNNCEVCIGWGRKQNTNKNPGRNPRY